MSEWLKQFMQKQSAVATYYDHRPQTMVRVVYVILPKLLHIVIQWIHKTRVRRKEGSTGSTISVHPLSSSNSLGIFVGISLMTKNHSTHVRSDNCLPLTNDSEKCSTRDYKSAYRISYLMRFSNSWIHYSFQVNSRKCTLFLFPPYVHWLAPTVPP